MPSSTVWLPRRWWCPGKLQRTSTPSGRQWCGSFLHQPRGIERHVHGVSIAYGSAIATRGSDLDRRGKFLDQLRRALGLVGELYVLLDRDPELIKALNQIRKLAAEFRDEADKFRWDDGQRAYLRRLQRACHPILGKAPDPLVCEIARSRVWVEPFRTGGANPQSQFGDGGTALRAGTLASGVKRQSRAELAKLPKPGAADV